MEVELKQKIISRAKLLVFLFMSFVAVYFKAYFLSLMFNMHVAKYFNLGDITAKTTFTILLIYMCFTLKSKKEDKKEEKKEKSIDDINGKEILEYQIITLILFVILYGMCKFIALF